jgi:hypothetical protein
MAPQPSTASELPVPLRRFRTKLLRWRSGRGVELASCSPRCRKIRAAESPVLLAPPPRWQRCSERHRRIRPSTSPLAGKP